MEFFDIIFWAGFALLAIFAICFTINFATDNEQPLIVVIIGFLGICLGLYSGSMTTPVCSSCGTRCTDERDSYCSVCGDVWDDNDLHYWQTKE